MNNFFKVVLCCFLLFLVVSCNEDDETLPQSTIILEDFAVQYKKDSIKIENFLKNNYLEIINNPGQPDDLDTQIKTIPTIGPPRTSIADMPGLKFRMVPFSYINKEGNKKDFKYKLYYLELRKGAGERPCNVDDVFVGYKGQILNENIDDKPIFETSTSSDLSFPLYNSVIRGWSEILPQFNTAAITENSDGSNNYNNFGAGLMFIPSGLAYFNTRRSNLIIEYSTLIFSFKLFNVRRTDQDNDGILSYLEDIGNPNGAGADGYVYNSFENATDIDTKTVTTTYFSNDNTDKDNLPDFLDIDDDADGTATRIEISRTGTINGPFYPFNSVLDNPFTPFNEALQGIPDCDGNSTNPNRLRKYLDSSCK